MKSAGQIATITYE
jgi:cGMP-dependent protein kinase 1